MNILHIHEIPKNFEAFATKPIGLETDKEISLWLQTQMGNGTSDLHLKKCPLSIVEKHYAELIQNNYKILILPIEGISASVDFYFTKSPVQTSQPCFHDGTF